MQPSFDLKAEKRVQTTSIQAYREIAPSLSRREGEVMETLRQYQNVTAYELFVAMRRLGVAFDLNAVRPRLTALYAKHQVERGGKRICTVTGKTAFTWRTK